MNSKTMRRKSGLVRIIAAVLALMLMPLLPAAAAGAEPAGEAAPVVVLRIQDYGDIYLEVYPDIAPVTAENFLHLVDSGFYNGLTFHRIIENFMVQGGCPLGNGTGSSDRKIKGEFTSNGFDNPLQHERGVLSMARSSDPDSASCQFFIVHADSAHLDGNYAAFGRVIAGMGVIDSMCVNAHVTDSNGTVPGKDQPVILEAVRADRAEAEAAAALEKENGTAGGTFTDPVSGLSFPMPEGWYLQGGTGGKQTFTDGTSILYLNSFDLWRQMGRDMQEQYAAGGYERSKLSTGVYTRSAFAGIIGADENILTEETVNDNLWYAASMEKNGIPRQYRIGVINGNVMVFTAAEGTAVQAMEAILSSLKAE